MKENMYDNFGRLNLRVLDSMKKTDLIKIKENLISIVDPTLVSGVGGSSVVSNFVAKVLNKKNNIICESVTPRDLLYINKDCYKNIIACSYSGNNFGVDIALDNNLNKYLFSKKEKTDITNINYSVSEKENSFISLSATLIPMTILLFYYCEDMDLIEQILNSRQTFRINKNLVYEILSGYETSTAAKFIETTMVEAGIGIPVIHDKYDFCHGRTTLGFNSANNLIFFDCGSELDLLYRQELDKYYQNLIVIDKKFDDEIINDYYLTYISMLLCKEIAQEQNKDLSCVDYSPLVKKIYYFKGGM